MSLAGFPFINDIYILQTLLVWRATASHMCMNVKAIWMLLFLAVCFVFSVMHPELVTRDTAGSLCSIVDVFDVVCLFSIRSNTGLL